MLSWDRLRVFASVARHGSVRAAAEELCISGPAVSQHLRRLEKEAGRPLVEPEGRGLRLTQAGRVLADSVRDMTEAATRAEVDLADADSLVAGQLRIGSVASAVRTLLPAVLRRLSERHPRLEPELRDGEAEEMLPLLRTGQLDAVVLESWTHWPAYIPTGVHTTELLRETAWLAVPSDHPLADLGSVPLSELHGQVWASCPPGSDAHESLVQLLRTHGDADAKVRYRMADYTTQLQLVAAGLSFALVPTMAAHPLPAGVRLVRCEPAVTRTVAAATVRGGQTPQVRAFMAAMTHASGDEPRPDLRPTSQAVGPPEAAAAG